MKDHPSNTQNKHIAAYEPQDILKFCGESKRLFVVDGVDYNVKMQSARYYTFRESLSCVCCGLTGKTMMLDVQPRVRHGKAHFNLYAEWEGGLVLMTKDHIIPRSRGGKNYGDNYQTMCTLCNGAKKDKMISVEELCKHPEVADRIDRMKLIQIIKETAAGWGKDPYDINNGDCDAFMTEVIKKTGWHHNKIGDLTSDNFVCQRELPDHIWIDFNNRHFDAECPEGVNNWMDLPLFARVRNNPHYKEVFDELEDGTYNFVIPE